MRIEILKQIVREAGRQGLSYTGKYEFTLKKDNTHVTKADILIQDFLQHRLKSVFPPYTFLAEEKENCFSSLASEDFVWIIDPVDGTDAFLEGVPTWGVAVALVHQFKPVMSVFYMPVSDTLFYTDENGTAYENGRVMHRPDSYQSGVVYVTSDFHKLADWQGYKGKVRSLGSTIAHFCYVARGSGAGAVVCGFAWDIVPGLAILEATGGSLFTFDGTYFDLESFLKSGKRSPYLIASPTKEFPAFASSFIMRK